MVSRLGDAVCTLRRCELRHLAAWAERVITRREINVFIGRVGVRQPRLQQLSPCLVAGSRQYPRVDEVELMAFLQRKGHDRYQRKCHRASSSRHSQDPATTITDSTIDNGDNQQ
nr:unnamed protein product [Spirometra erinaceieuropaei]